MKEASPTGRGHRKKKKLADRNTDHTYESEYNDYSLLQNKMNLEYSFLQVPFEELSETQHHQFLKVAIENVKESGETNFSASMLRE